MKTTQLAIDQIVSRIRTMKPAERAEFLRLQKMTEIEGICTVLAGAAKPKTPRPVLERRILSALDGAAAEAEQEPKATKVAKTPRAPKEPKPAADYVDPELAKAQEEAHGEGFKMPAGIDLNAFVASQAQTRN